MGEKEEERKRGMKKGKRKARGVPHNIGSGENLLHIDSLKLRWSQEP